MVPAHMDGECLGCGIEFEYDEGDCPECGWGPEAFRARGRHGLGRPGHGEPEDDSSGGPPPGPDGVTGI